MPLITWTCHRRFCCEVQEALLKLDWPRELLETEKCREVWVAEKDAGAAGCDSGHRHPFGTTGDDVLVGTSFHGPKLSPQAASLLPSSRLEEEVEEGVEVRGHSPLNPGFLRPSASKAHEWTLWQSLKDRWAEVPAPVQRQPIKPVSSFDTIEEEHQRQHPMRHASSLNFHASSLNFHGPQQATAASGDGGGAVLVFRGLRVRMGMHSGATPASISSDLKWARTQYTGVFLNCARSISDGACGGQILVPEVSLCS